MRHHLSFVLAAVVAALVAFPPAAVARDAGPEPLIWDVRVIYGGRPDLECGVDWRKIDVDLNADFGGDYVFLCVSHDRQHFVEPVAGLKVCHTECEAPYDMVPAFPVTFPGYLNAGRPNGDPLVFGYYRNWVDPLVDIKFELSEGSPAMPHQFDWFRWTEDLNTVSICNGGTTGVWQPMSGEQDLNAGATRGGESSDAVYIVGCERHRLPTRHVNGRAIYGLRVVTGDTPCPDGWIKLPEDLNAGSWSVFEFGDEILRIYACITRSAAAEGAYPHPLSVIGTVAYNESVDELTMRKCADKGGAVVNAELNGGIDGNLNQDGGLLNARNIFFCVSRTHVPLAHNTVVDDVGFVLLDEGSDDIAATCREHKGADWFPVWALNEPGFNDLNAGMGGKYIYACQHYSWAYHDDFFNPVIAADDQTATATQRIGPGSTGAFVAYAVSAEAAGHEIPVSCEPASGSLFTTGATEVSCSADDRLGRRTEASFTVRVVDEPPTIASIEIPTAEATSPAGAVVTFSVTAVDAIDGARPVSCAPPSGSTFPLGNSHTECASSDIDGHSRVRALGVYVRDTTPPTIVAPPDVYVQYPGLGQPIPEALLGVPQAHDAVGIEGFTRTPASLLLGEGTHTLTWTAYDRVGLTASATQQVTVGLAPPPVATPPPDLTVEATSPAGALVSPAQLGQPLVNGPVASVSRAPAGNSFPLGSTVVTWTITAPTGAIAYARQTVRVIDSTAPAVEGPAEVTIEAQHAGGASVHLQGLGVRATDTVVVLSLMPVPVYPQFPLGRTDVVWTARDAAGNTGTLRMTINIVDRTPPVIDRSPATLVVEGHERNGAFVADALLGTLTARDTVSVVTVTRLPAGNHFHLGDQYIQWTARDGSGNTTHAAQLVRVIDTTAPRLELPPSLTAEAGDPDGAIVVFSAGAADVVDGAMDAACAPASGSRFALGQTSVLCSAADRAGNRSHGAFTVNVVDTTPPAITAPPDLQLEAENARGATLGPAGLGQAGATDAIGPVRIMAPAVSNWFPLGESVVTWSAVDGAGNMATVTQRIRVVDTTPPALTLPGEVAVEAAHAGGAVVRYEASAVDAVDGTRTVDCSIGSSAVVPLGRHVVSCSAQDSRGNSAHGTFTVTVLDRTAPAVDAVAASPDEVWPPNNDMVDVGVTVTATDLVSTPTSRIVDITGNDGAGSDDWQILGPLTAMVRAERSGTGSGRTYIITVETSDAAGNSVRSTATVVVLHDGGRNQR